MRACATAGIELVCNAGFMRVLTAFFVDSWRDRQLNIHPSLLPAFPGLDTHARALAAGVTLQRLHRPFRARASRRRAVRRADQRAGATRR